MTMLSRIQRALALTRPATRSLRSSACRRNEQTTDTLLPPVPPRPTALSSSPAPNLQDPHVFLDIPPAEDPLLRHITSSIMVHGRRHSAERRVKNLLLHLYAFTRSPPLPLLRSAVDRASPYVRVVGHKKGGKTTYNPIPLTEKQRVHLAVEWMVNACKSKSGLTIEERLAREVLDVLKGESAVLKKKGDVHTLAMVNRGTIKIPISS